MNKKLVQQSAIVSAFMDQSTSKEKLELLKELLSVLDVLHTHKAENYNRSLPPQEYLVDRWERANLLGFGDGTSIYGSATVLGEVSVGNSTWIGPNVLLDGSGGLTIGSNCSISSNVQIYSHDSVEWATSGGTSGYQYESTSIGNNCYIGPNTVIEKGVTIGNRVIIGANSFVNSDIEDEQKFAGNPAKKIL